MSSHLQKYEETLARQLQERAANDLRLVLDTAQGRRLAWWILGLAGVYRGSFTGEPLTSAHNEGRRAVGIDLLTRIETEVPGSYLAMMREALDEQTMIDNGRRNAADRDAAEAEGEM